MKYLSGLLMGMLFAYVIRRSWLCFTGLLRDFYLMGRRCNALYFFTIISVQGLIYYALGTAGLVRIPSYLPPFSLFSIAVGSFLFGFGAVLAGGCMTMTLVMCGAGQASGTEAAYKHLEAEEAAALIESGECVLIDVRSGEEFLVEHIPGAVNIPHDSDDESFTSALPDKNKPILLYCDYGGISKDTAEHLSRDLGYTDVSEFDGLLVWEGDTVSGE